MKNIQCALAAATKVIRKKTTLEILQHVLLRSDGKTLSITASDLDTYVTTSVAARFPAFEVCILPNYLAAAIEHAQEIAIHPSEGKLEIVAGNLSIQAPTLPKGEFPVLETTQKGKAPMRASLLRDIARLAPFASRDETRYPINGVRFDTSTVFQGTTGWCVATDRRRITAIKPDGQLPFEGTIENKAVELLQEITDAGTCSAHIYGSRATACFEINTSWGNYRLETRTVDARYPKWTEVIMEIGATKSRWNPTGLAAEIHALQTLAKNGDGSVRIKFGHTGCRLRTSEAEIETKQITLTEGTSMEPAFNMRFVQEMISLFQTTEFTVEVESEMEPLRASAGEIVHTLMPMRLPALN